jgi:hypothetical protein
MTNSKETGMWMGKRLGDMSREELYDVIESIDNLRKRDDAQHLKDLDSLK